jgi:hypothetical protein
LKPWPEHGEASTTDLLLGWKSTKLNKDNPNDRWKGLEVNIHWVRYYFIYRDDGDESIIIG